MPDAAYLVVHEDEHRNAFLIRFSIDGAFAGDTWHLTLAEAKAYARNAFPEMSEWTQVPDDVVDLLEFARRTQG